MADEVVISKLEPTERNKRLLKEAYSLSVELGAMDKKIDADVRRINGDFAVSFEEFLDGSPSSRFVADQAKSTAIEKSIGGAFSKLAKLFRLGIREIPLLSVGIDLLTAEKGASYRAAYLDSPGDPKLLEYDSKRARLKQIYLELSTAITVPLHPNFEDACRHDACWIAR